jgi:hypothetical protein
MASFLRVFKVFSLTRLQAVNKITPDKSNTKNYGEDVVKQYDEMNGGWVA